MKKRSDKSEPKGPSLSLVVAALTFEHLMRGHDISDAEIVTELETRGWNPKILSAAMSVKRPVISRVRTEIRRALQDRSAVLKAMRDSNLVSDSKPSIRDCFLRDFYDNKRRRGQMVKKHTWPLRPLIQ